MKYSKIEVSVFVCSFVLLLIQGCATPPPRTRIVPKSPTTPTVNRNPEAQTIILKWLEDASFEIEDLSTEIVNNKTLIISGRVTNPVLTFTCQSVKGEYRAIGAWGTNKVWYTVESGPKYVINEPWDCSINIHGDHLNPGPDGFFKITLNASNDSYFIEPRTKNYTKIKIGNELAFSASKSHHMSLPRGMGGYISGYESCSVPLKDIPIYTVYYDIDKAAKFARRLMPIQKCLINLEFKEQITRRSVSPEITITPVNAPTKESYFDSLKSKLQLEFNNDSALVDAGMEAIEKYNAKPYYVDGVAVGYIPNKNEDVLWGGRIKKDNAQAISFVGLVGQKYKIETVHGEYNYFRGFITPSSSNPVNKTVLLIEKGEKIRMQEVREGEGGSMVDSD